MLAPLAGRIYDHAPQQNADPLGSQTGPLSMPELFNSFFYIAMLTGPFVGYLLAARWPHARRWHLVAAATIGAGLPSAIWAALSTLAGQTTADIAPFALVATGFGAFVGLCGVIARSLGGWFAGRPD